MGSRIDGPAAAGQAPTATAAAELGDGSSETQPRSGVMQRLIRVLRPGRKGDDGTGAPVAPHATSPHTAVHGMANLRKLRVDDVSVPKVDIISVPTDIGRDELVGVFRQHGFSRVPVYKGTLDHPQGLILFKDLALQHGFGATGRFSLRKLLRPLIYVPPSMPVGVLLQKMQRERVHMALVIDEYGGVDGLVTIEDLIETVIGEIDDEHDERGGAQWKEEKPGVYLAQAMAPLAEFEAAIGMRLRNDDDDADIDTLGGIVFQRAGRVPARGEVVAHESGVQFEVVDADPRRIKRLRVRLPTAIGAATGPTVPDAKVPALPETRKTAAE
jgi:magnesium and cobalt transporter